MLGDESEGLCRKVQIIFLNLKRMKSAKTENEAEAEPEPM